MTTISSADNGTPLDEAALTRAWIEVERNDAEDGEIGPAIQRFKAKAEKKLAAISAAIAAGTYRPRPLVEVPIVSGERTRVLHIPSVADRVVARAVLEHVNPRVDPLLGDCAFGSRPGLGVRDAIQALVRKRELGYEWVLRTDVDNCFPAMSRDLALSRIEPFLLHKTVKQVVVALLSRRISSKHGTAGSGLPQGCPLSPLLANLVLAEADEAMQLAGFQPVRYVDDIAVATRDRQEAETALLMLSRALRELGLEVGADKTEIMSFTEGFCFLGEDFGPRYPASISTHRVEEPVKRVLYIGLDGSCATVRQGRLRVRTREDVEVLDVPTTHVSRLVCFGSVGVGPSVRNWAMNSDVDVVFNSRRGNYQGILSTQARRSERVRQQVEILDTEVELELARRIVSAKTGHQMTVLKRFNSPETSAEVTDAVMEMKALLPRLDECGSIAEVMGIEGAAGAQYFGVYGKLFPEDLRFDRRSRRPPLDTANAGLSYLYTILLGEVVGAVVAAGLEPSIGVLHRDDGRRPSLALDLMEELRPLVVDRVVLTAARQNRLKSTDGHRKDGNEGILLTKSGRKTLTSEYETRMQTSSRMAIPGFAGSIRRLLYLQAARMADSITTGVPLWTGLSWR